ncbi:MAG: DNA primase [Dehalococcoidales bacterium]|nr:DNA primase [Dehalococcoidales bacterium]
MGVIDEVKQRIDIVEVVSQHTTLTKSGRTFKGLCPFHSEKHGSFFVYPEQQSWHCFGACNTGGDVFSFVMKKEGFDFGEALRSLARQAGVTIPTRFEPEPKKDEKERLYQANGAAAQYFHHLLINSPAGEKAKSYLDSRGILPDTITTFQLGLSQNSWEALKQYLMERDYTEKELLEAGLVIASENGETHDRFRNKLMFPILDERGRVTAFGARVLDDSQPKYINSPQTPVFDKSGSLYAINLAAPAIRQQNQAVIVEGYMDVITAHQNGFTNVIASMGTSITEKQVAALKRLTKNIALALDADAAGEEATLRSISFENTLDVEVKFVILPEGKDPDAVIRENKQTWQELIAGALPVVDYTFTRDESSAVDRLLPLIARIKDDLRRDRYLTKLAKLTGIDYKKLEAASQGYLVRQDTRRTKTATAVRAMPPLLSRPLEEECLALLLQHPELGDSTGGLLPEYFEDSQNREIFLGWQTVSDPTSLKEKLDASLWEQLERLINRKILATRIKERYNQYALRLREEYLRNLARKRAISSSSKTDPDNTIEVVKPDEQDLETSRQLREVFLQKASQGWERGDRK